MKPPIRYRLSDAEKDALLAQQATLIEQMAARIAELEAALKQPKKTPKNSHLPPSQGGPGGKASRQGDRPKRERPSRPGSSRPLADSPDKTERRMADNCPHCGTETPPERQHPRHCYDHIDLPPVRPVVTRIESNCSAAVAPAAANGIGPRHRRGWRRARRSVRASAPCCCTCIIATMSVSSVCRGC